MPVGALRPGLPPLQVHKVPQGELPRRYLDQQIAVQVVVDSSAADGSVSYDGTVELAEGATVLDAIEATGLELDVQDSEYGAFVNAIGGLATGDAGDASGWGYDLNGEMVMESADVATVADGDVLTWTYLV